MSTKVYEQVLENVQSLMALQLWQLGAIQVNVNDPWFTLTNKNRSPIYINCRRLISSPAFLDLFTGAARIMFEHRDIDFDFVAGGETAGIPFAAYIARAFGKPMIYVRKEIKEHGIPSKIEGVLESGKRVLLVEDLITDAGSKMSFIKAIRKAEATVSDVLVVFDRLQGGAETLNSHDIRLFALTDMDAALFTLESTQSVPKDQISEIRGYLADPRRWHEERSKDFFE